MAWNLMRLMVTQEYSARFRDSVSNDQCGMTKICGELPVYIKPGNLNTRVNMLSSKALSLFAMGRIRLSNDRLSRMASGIMKNRRQGVTRHLCHLT